MKLVCAGSKNSPTYYIQKSVRINGKSTTKTVERLGSIEEIKARCGKADPLEWAKEYAKMLTASDKESKKSIMVKYTPLKLLDKNIRNTCNAGYLFLQYIYYSLGLNKICDSISSKYNFEYNLNDIMKMLVFTRIIEPGSKISSLNTAHDFLEQPVCELHQVYRALEVYAENSDSIQAQLYKNSLSVLQRKTDVIYYDCTNFYFEIEEEDDFRRYGLSKEHRPNPIVQMGLFMDSNGIPLSFSLFNGNENEQPSMTPLETKILQDFKQSGFVVCTDAGLASTANRKFNSVQGRGFITAQPVRKLKKFLKDFCLSDDGWMLPGSNKKYKISELDEEKYQERLFFKERWINENGLEQRLIVTYSIKYRNYQRCIRERQIARANSYIASPSALAKKKANDPKRFITQTHCTNDGEIASKTIAAIDQKLISEEAVYDGIYAVCTNLETPAASIIKINQRRWEIEECFRIMKTEFKARPVYLSRKDRISAHFLTCFISLIIYRILESRLNSEYTCDSIIKTLRKMNMQIIPGEGYIPSYTRTDLTDQLHDAFGFRTDYQIISQQNMRKIINKTKTERK